MIGSRGLARAKAKIGWQNLTYNIGRQPAGPAIVASGTDGSCLETNNRNSAIGHSILTQHNVNLKIEPLKCNF